MKLEKECVSEKKVTIKNKLGLHARPAAMFVELSSKFVSDIFVQKDENEVNGKSIMGVMMLAAGYGAKLKIRAIGKDSKQAIEALEKLVQDRFYEE